MDPFFVNSHPFFSTQPDGIIGNNIFMYRVIIIEQIYVCGDICVAYLLLPSYTIIYLCYYIFFCVLLLKFEKVVLIITKCCCESSSQCVYVYTENHRWKWTSKITTTTTLTDIQYFFMSIVFRYQTQYCGKWAFLFWGFIFAVIAVEKMLCLKYVKQLNILNFICI